MTTVALAPVARQLFLNPSTGAPASGFRLFVYEAGTTTKTTTYVDSSGTTPNTDPIILDSLGECDIWLVPGTAYKFVFSPPTDTDPPTNAIWTVDGISIASGGATSGASTFSFLTTTDLLSAFAAPISLPDGATATTTGRTAEGIGGATFYYNASDTSTVDNGGTVRVDGAGRRWYALGTIVAPELFGAVGNGTTDDTAAFTAAMTVLSALGGSTLFGRPTTYVVNNLPLQNGVVIQGAAYWTGNLPNGINGTTFKSTVSGYTITSAARATAIRNVNFQGPGAGTTCGGIHYTSGDTNLVEACFFNNYSGSAILEASSVVGNYYNNLKAQNCLLGGASLVAFTGVFDLSGTDQFCYGFEATTSQASLFSASQFAAAIRANGTNGFYTSCLGELSDCGWVVSGSQNRLTNCRGDLNFGAGFNVTGGKNSFSSGLALNNSQDTTNTYDGWAVSGVLNTFAACRADSLTSAKHRYGFNDTVNSDSTKNFYDSTCISINAVTQQYINQSRGSVFTDKMGPAVLLTVNSATPSVDGYSCYFTTNTSATSITTFSLGLFGQALDIFIADANTSFVNGSTLKTATGSTETPSSGQKAIFKNRAGIWYQMTAFV